MWPSVKNAVWALASVVFVIHRLFWVPLAEWWIDTLFSIPEEVIKGFVRESFALGARITNGVSVVFVSLLIDGSYWLHHREVWSDEAEQRRPWTKPSTLNALVERVAPDSIPSAPASAPSPRSSVTSQRPSTHRAFLGWFRGKDKPAPAVDSGVAPVPRALQSSQSSLRPAKPLFHSHTDLTAVNNPRGVFEDTRMGMELLISRLFELTRSGVRRLWLVPTRDRPGDGAGLHMRRSSVDTIDGLKHSASVAALADHVPPRRRRVPRARSFSKLEELQQQQKRQDQAVVTAADLIRKAGYPAEEHNVTTSDGYMLRMERIPRPGAKQVAFFVHGVMDTSLSWVCNGVTGSQAFAAWDEGFDVWLANSRCNPPRMHADPAIRGPAYWHYTVNELGIQDMHAQVEHIHMIKCTELGAGVIKLHSGRPSHAGRPAQPAPPSPLRGNASIDLPRQPRRNATLQPSWRSRASLSVQHASDTDLAARWRPDGSGAKPMSSAHLAVPPSLAPIDTPALALPVLVPSTSHSSPSAEDLAEGGLPSPRGFAAAGVASHRVTTTGSVSPLPPQSPPVFATPTSWSLASSVLSKGLSPGQFGDVGGGRGQFSSAADSMPPSSPSLEGSAWCGGRGGTEGGASASPGAGSPAAGGFLSWFAGASGVAGEPVEPPVDALGVGAARASPYCNVHDDDFEGGADLVELRLGGDTTPPVSPALAGGPGVSPFREDDPGASSSSELAMIDPSAAVAGSGAVSVFLAGDGDSRIGDDAASAGAVSTDTATLAGSVAPVPRPPVHGPSPSAPAALPTAASPLPSPAPAGTCSRSVPPQSLPYSALHASASAHSDGRAPGAPLCPPLSSAPPPRPSVAPSRRPVQDVEPYTMTAIGHSLGGACLLMYAVSSLRARRRHRLAKLVLLTPAGFIEGVPAIMRPLARALPLTLRLLNWLFPAVLSLPFYLPSSLLRSLTFRLTADLQHVPALSKLWKAWVTLCMNGDPSDWDRAMQMPHYNKHSMPAVSLLQALHMLQWITTNRFELFDYGSAALNMAAYGQRGPPSIAAEYWRLDIPVDIAAGRNDKIIRPDCVKKHVTWMQAAGVSRLTYKEFDFGHLDFTFSAREDLRHHVMQCLQRA